MSPWIPITVAVIGALVSVGAAAVAGYGAAAARKSAETLSSRAHRIARLDAEAEELREAFKAYALEMGKLTKPTGGLPVMAALEVLAACQAVTPELESAAMANIDGITRASMTGNAEGVDPTPVRLAYKAAQKLIADKREAETTDKV